MQRNDGLKPLISFKCFHETQNNKTKPEDMMNKSSTFYKLRNSPSMISQHSQTLGNWEMLGVIWRLNNVSYFLL
ncbi:CLUMA_CG018413, isoform A [Clunio marinus]|uniref:CLUMA_CG018413, isoform A n=1 Tax=Clunio marinus TaxID=568069 RepID=A0A1J1IXW6_9DIPT|nr:CLUMA_CG018413, isoform A [Clunio marinus]